MHESRAHGVHNPLHRLERRKGSCPAQGPDSRESGLAEEGPRAARPAARAAACAAWASATAPATMSRTVASSARRRARACAGPFPRRRGIVLWALQCAALGGGWGANRCNKCATDVGSFRCTWMHRRAAPAGPAWWCVGVRAPWMRCCSSSSSVRRRGSGGGSGQEQLATWEHCAHMLVPASTVEDTVSHAPQMWRVCGR